MSDSGSREIDMVTANVDSALKDAAMRNLEHGELTEEIEKMLQRIAFGEEVAEGSAIRAELESARGEYDAAQAEIEQIQARQRERQTKITRLEERLDNEKSRQQKYEGHIESLETSLYQGARVWAGDDAHAGVEQAASVGERQPSHVVSELQERNPAIPGYAFQKSTEDEKSWDGVDGGSHES